MRTVIQRVSQASVTIRNSIKAEIGPGLLVLVGIESTDNESDIDWLSNKIVNLRIFNDTGGTMNLSVLDSGGDIMVISQFTLHARTKKGNRPSYIKAAHPEIAVPLYDKFIQKLSDLLGKMVPSGEFGAMMKVSLVNEGPVTIFIDTRERE
jgi:D-tyrosyl-tRNA(Tyr) deacylase